MALTKIDDRGLKTPIDLLDNEKIRFGTGNDLEIYHSGTSSYIQDNGTGDLIIRASDQLKIQDTDNGESMAIFNKDGAVELYYDNSKKLETTSWGVDCQGNTRTSGDFVCVDNGKFRAGNSSDLQIYHNGSLSLIENNTGNLYIDTKVTDGEIRFTSNGVNENMIRAVRDAQVELYYDGSKKFETTTAGIEVISTGNTPQIDYVGASNNALGRIDCDAISGTTSNMRFYVETGGSIAEKLRIQTGGGISFNGDTAAANALDDYEEGTWDAYVMDSGGGGSQNISINNVVAKYRKIGSQVTCWFSLTRNETGSRSGDVKWNNSLPFTVANGGTPTSGTWWLDEGGPSSGDSVGGAIYLTPGTTQGLFVHPTSPAQNSTNRYLQYSEWSQHRPIYGSFTYYV
tara:strand:+ start:2022 stop:3221 length:1200 start_codon:yes stop_codon:yes gene_type:complete